MARSAQIPARREFKYLIDRSRLPALRAALSPFCGLDAHAGADRAYGLRSLYFDSPDMRLYHANEREAPVRFKARVRWYSDAESSPIYAEIKLRDGDVIKKTRTSLPTPDWASGLRAGAPVGPFGMRMHRHDLRPVALVDYRREAYMSRVDEYARISIDTQIRCQEQDRWSLEANPRRWRAIDHPLQTWMTTSPCVVELKWADYAPSWMVSLVQQLDMLRFSFSKYCYSMLALSEDHYRDYREAQSRWG